MSHIEDRWWKEVPDPTTRSGKKRIKKTAHGKGLRYRVRWVPPGGVEESESFPDGQKAAAENFKKELDLSMLAGTYVSPKSRDTPFLELLDGWYKGRSSDPATRHSTEGRVDRHIKPFFVKRYAAVSTACTNEAVNDWLAWLSRRGLELSTQLMVFKDLSSLMDYAQRSRLIHDNPCKSKDVLAPKPTQNKIIPWSPEKAHSIWVELPDYAKIAVPLGAGLGLRIGEICGLSPDDFRRRDGVVDIQRQVRMLPGGPVFSPPKGGKARVTPVPKHVLGAVDAFMDLMAPVKVSLPWRTLDGRGETQRLLMVGRDGSASHANRFDCGPWRTAFERAGLTRRRNVDGPHALRHLYASALLEKQVSINDLAEYLGHHNPSVTLRYYAHMMPSSHERARVAGDAVWHGIASAGAGVEGDSDE